MPLSGPRRRDDSDNCQIGHNVVFATLNHGTAPEHRADTYPAPITLGRNV